MEKMNLWERYAQFYQYGVGGRVDVDATNEVFGSAWNGSMFWTYAVPNVTFGLFVLGCIVMACRMVF